MTSPPLPPCFWEVLNTPGFIQPDPQGTCNKAGARTAEGSRNLAGVNLMGRWNLQPCRVMGTAGWEEKHSSLLLSSFSNCNFFSMCFLLIVSGMFWVVVSNTVFSFSSLLFGKWSKLTNIFQMGWCNHQLSVLFGWFCYVEIASGSNL